MSSLVNSCFVNMQFYVIKTVPKFVLDHVVFFAIVCISLYSVVNVCMLLYFVANVSIILYRILSSLVLITLYFVASLCISLQDDASVFRKYIVICKDFKMLQMFVQISL